MIFLKDFITAKEYAKLCRVELSTISYRHRKGNIASIKIGNSIFVNPKLSPPERFHHRYSPKPDSGSLLPPFMRASQLISVYNYAYKNGIRPDSLYRLALLDKIQSVVIDGNVYILKSEAAAISKKKQHHGS